MSQTLQSLPGFRDFYPRECAVRNYVFEAWRRVAARYGFVEWEAPVLEPTALYRKKSGDEITQQLFCFEDKGGREVALRPELTPTLARMASARQRDFRKPLKWFQIGACFRYEAPQKGRLREFYQWNCDVLGEESAEADAELIALGIDALRELGFGEEDFAVRLSDRNVWNTFLAQQNVPTERAGEFLQIIDKWEREKPEVLDQRLGALGTTRAAVADFIEATKSDSAHFAPLVRSLTARGMGGFVRIDPGIVRGLAYYTGTVFEFFALKHGARAIAGGGRYDGLCALISDGSVDMPAAGFAMGDVVLGNLIEATATANSRLQSWLLATCAVDAWVVTADETRRAEALGVLQALRAAGLRADTVLTPAKMGKQFQAAEAQKARVAVIIGSEWPVVKVKDLSRREEATCGADSWLPAVRAVLSAPLTGPLLA